MVCSILALLVLGASAGTNEVGKKFLEENGKRPGVITLASGLQYKVLREGHGDQSPLAGTPCECHYAGTTPSLTPDVVEKEKESDWDEFDSSYKRGSPTTFAPNQAEPFKVLLRSLKRSFIHATFNLLGRNYTSLYMHHLDVFPFESSTGDQRLDRSHAAHGGG